MKMFYKWAMFAVMFRMADDAPAADPAPSLPTEPVPDIAGDSVVPDTTPVVADISTAPATVAVPDAEHIELLARIEAALSTGEQWILDNIRAMVDAVEKSM